MACYLYGLGTSLHAEAVVAELDAVDAAKRTPEEVFLAILFDEEGVDAVLHTDILTDEECPMIGIRTLGA